MAGDKTVSDTSGKAGNGVAALARKLGLRPAQRICVLDAPPASAALIRAATPEDCALTSALEGDAHTRYDLIFCWPVEPAGLSERFAALQRRIVPDGAVWVVLPKKPVARNRVITLTWEQMQAAALTTDLVDNKIASLGDEEYATRFVIRRHRRAGATGV